MFKEINEQPNTIKYCIEEYVDSLKKNINILNFPIEPKKINKIILIGCGTAYNSCLTAKYWFEELTSIDVEIDIASEFRYRKLKFNPNNLYIFVSQSGETADTAAALDICKKNNVKTCSIVNVIESTIARNSVGFAIHAIKTVLHQLKTYRSTNSSIYCAWWHHWKKDIDEKFIKNINNLKKLPEAIKKCIESE